MSSFRKTPYPSTYSSSASSNSSPCTKNPGAGALSQRKEHRVSSREEIVYTPPPPRTIQTQEVHAFYPEQIYIASVISMHSPAELREFMHHCITQLTNQTPPSLLYNHDLREIRHITTSTLHFQNLLWRKSVSITNNNITESYSWIRRLCFREDQTNHT